MSSGMPNRPTGAFLTSYSVMVNVYVLRLDRNVTCALSASQSPTISPISRTARKVRKAGYGMGKEADSWGFQSLLGRRR